MIGIVIANNTILMYVFWELTSISHSCLYPIGTIMVKVN